jgi:hypothetical protein
MGHDGQVQQNPAAVACSFFVSAFILTQRETTRKNGPKGTGPVL